MPYARLGKPKIRRIEYDLVLGTSWLGSIPAGAACAQQLGPQLASAKASLNEVVDESKQRRRDSLVGIVG